MKTIAFFNNKGGVGKTSLVYHLAWMFGELGYKVIAADLDPQSNLSGMFLEERRLEELWEERNGNTIDGDIAPLFEGTGDINTHPHIEEVNENVGLLVGDLALTKREDDLSEQWPKCLSGDKRAFRVTTAFSRLIGNAAKEFHPDIALVDVGPNLGAINRVALITSDYVVIPLAPDLFSLQGLRNVLPTLQQWRDDWRQRREKKPKDIDIDLPTGEMEPIGYVIMRHSVRYSQPVQAYERWIKKMPDEYKKLVFKNDKKNSLIERDDCLAHLKDYQSLMPMAQETGKPMFKLKPADGAIGAQQSAVGECYKDFKQLAEKIFTVCDIPPLEGTK